MIRCIEAGDISVIAGPVIKILPRKTQTSHNKRIGGGSRLPDARRTVSKFVERPPSAIAGATEDGKAELRNYADTL